jgi:hypothetical protein
MLEIWYKNNDIITFGGEKLVTPWYKNYFFYKV